MHVLVTRPKDDGETLKAELEQIGCKVTLEPLIRIVSNDVPATAIDETSTRRFPGGGRAGRSSLSVLPRAAWPGTG